MPRAWASSQENNADDAGNKLFSANTMIKLLGSCSSLKVLGEVRLLMVKSNSVMTKSSLWRSSHVGQSNLLLVTRPDRNVFFFLFSHNTQKIYSSVGVNSSSMRIGPLLQI